MVFFIVGEEGCGRSRLGGIGCVILRCLVDKRGGME